MPSSRARTEWRTPCTKRRSLSGSLRQKHHRTSPEIRQYSYRKHRFRVSPTKFMRSGVRRKFSRVVHMSFVRRAVPVARETERAAAPRIFHKLLHCHPLAMHPTCQLTPSFGVFGCLHIRCSGASHVYASIIADRIQPLIFCSLGQSS